MCISWIFVPRQGDRFRATIFTFNIFRQLKFKIMIIINTMYHKSIIDKHILYIYYVTLDTLAVPQQ